MFLKNYRELKDKVFPRRRYRTRSVSKAMDEQEKLNEEMRNDIGTLKEQMTQILEKLMELGQKNTEGVESSQKNMEGTPQGMTFTPIYPPGFTPAQAGMVPFTYHAAPQSTMESPEVQWPQYGLPPGYTPPTAQDVPATDSNPLYGFTPQGNDHPETQTTSQSQPARTQKPFTSQQTATIPPHQLGNSRNQSTTPAVTFANMRPFSVEGSQSDNKLQILEDRLKAVEGNNYGFGEATDLCLVTDVVIPPKFKAPDFHKYQGITCPKAHLTMYYRKMAPHAHNEKLLIHVFQDSLEGAALNWYTNLERARIHNWKDLAEAFVKQYKYNIDMAPDRLELQNMRKRDQESFKEYAQRWRETAARVQPPLSEREIVTIFIETLGNPFYEKMIGNIASNFSDIVMTGERIEAAIRSGKIAQPTPNSVKKPFNGTNNKGTANAVMVNSPGVEQFQASYPTSYINYSSSSSTPNPIRPYFMNSPSPSNVSTTKSPQSDQAHYQSNNQPIQQINQEQKPFQFDPIPIPYTELLPQLVEGRYLTTIPMRPVQPPYPKGYDPNAKCDYHRGVIGHSTENCRSLKFRVQDLINLGLLNFKEASPNVGTNPLPGHGVPSINAVGKDGVGPLKIKVEDIQTPMAFIFQEMCRFGLVKGNLVGDFACALHPKASHSIDECDEFKQVLQDLMDRHLIQVGCLKNNREVLMVDNPALKPLVVHYTKTAPTSPYNGLKPIIIQVPSPFPYKDSNAVPWRYDFQVCGGNFERDQPQRPDTEISDVTNIAGVGGVTRSGRIYIPDEVRNPPLREEAETYVAKGKGKLDQEVALEETAKESKDNKKVVSDEEACEFLKFIRQSEYVVMDQLNQIPARISLLTLLMNSEAHRKVLLKILKEAHVVHDISVEKLEGIVGNISANNYLTFTDDEMPAEGIGHNKALHISVKCVGCILGRVLIDNGSSLNVMPKSTLLKLSMDMSHIRPSTMIVRAFDGSRREVIGEVTLPVQVGPITFDVTFQVMDVTSAYSCLLGRPWIHCAGAVPSTLHQKVKFIVDNKLIIVSAEDDLLVSQPSSTPYIEAAEEALETSFQALEIANITYVKEGSPVAKYRPPDAAMMIAKVMLENGYQIGHGLGRDGRGLTEPLKLIENKDRFGLGYKPSKNDWRRVAEEKKERRLARLENREPKVRGVPICDLSQSFRSVGFLFPDSVAAIEEYSSDAERVDLVRVCPQNMELNNWEIIEFPTIFNSDSK